MLFQCPLKGQQRSHCIPGTCAQAALHRQSLVDGDGYPPAGLERGHGAFHDAIASVRLVPGDARIVTANLNACAAPHLHPNDVVQVNGLIHGEQIVKAVRPRRANAQAEVDFGEGADGDHGVMIVTTEDTEDTEGWPEFYPRGPCNPRLRSSLMVDRELKPGIR